MLKSLIILSFLLISSTVQATEYKGKVIAVLDGDTVKIRISKTEKIKVRLAQIDAPEKAQAFGMRSKKALSKLISGEVVRVVEEDVDRYGRIVGRIYHGKRDINAVMVKKGMAWVYRKYSKDQSLIRMERQAKTAKKGLWKDNNPLEPWEFRKPKRKKAKAAKQPKGCGDKRRCSEMSSCAEAKFYLNVCGIQSLDRDRDGLPCERLCN